MVFGILGLLAIPVIGLLLWIIKKVLKLTWPVAKIMLLVLAVWLVYTAATGGLNEVFGNISEPQIATEDGKTVYRVAFADRTLEVGDYITSDFTELQVDCILTKLTLDVPEDCIIRLSITGAVTQIVNQGEENTMWIGSDQMVIGSGSRIVDMRLNAALVKLTVR